MKKNLFMVLLTLMLGSYIWIYVIDGADKYNEEQDRTEKILKVSNENIVSLIIDDFETPFQFEKNKDEWLIISPIKTDADELAISHFLEKIENVKKIETLSVKSNEMDSYGVVKPTIKIIVTGSRGEVDSVLFGSITDINNIYMSKGLHDTVIAIVAAKIKNEAKRSLLFWRSKKLVIFNKEQVRAFSLKAGNKNFSLEKAGSEWRIIEPIKTLADNNTVQKLLSTLESGRINDIVDEKPASLEKFNLKYPEIEINLRLINSEQKKVTFSRGKGMVVFGKDESRPHIFSVSDIILEYIDKSLEDLRDKDLVDFDVASIDRINLLYDSNILTFNKNSSDKWEVNTGEAIQSYKIAQLVQTVQNIQVDKFVDENPDYLSPFGLAPSAGSLELIAGDLKVVELEIGSQNNGYRYLRVKPGRNVVAVNKEKMKTILIKLKDILIK